MSDTCVDRRRRTGVLLQTLLCWIFIELCCAGHRPYERGERQRYARPHDRWGQRIQYPLLQDQGTQRIEYPSVNDEGTQRVHYPSVHDRGQTILYPSVNDSSAGFQIQKCSPGYYRDGSGPFLGRCVPCQCNGLADECEEKTGRCLNCQYNTAGDRCERCKEGYYGNAAQRTCRVCPCPFSVATNSFAVGCREVFGDFQCICRAGYTGDKCESCAPGYYGDPLTPGGSCRPCNCNGNGNNCDPRTGVCKNTLEPGDTNTDQTCQECDNCAQTLLHDLEKLDDELGKIKGQLDNANASMSSQDRLKKLEQALYDTKILVNKYSTTINTQKSRVNQLKDDTKNLSDDISSLKDKADERANEADMAVEDVERTHRRAKDLDSEIRNTLKKIQALLDQLNEGSGSGTPAPGGNLSKMLEDAQRMVDEMNNRNLTPEKKAADKERDEAKKLLDYIKTNVSKQCDQNEAAAKKIQGLLKDYEDKLKDLDKAIKEAANLVKIANTQNGLNAQALRDLQERIEDLKKERKVVESKMAMAEDELQKTQDLEKMLSNSKMEYEQLAAQMDGAKTDLTKKVNEISKAAAKGDIVEAAEEHAKNLAKLAKDLEDTVKNASGRSEVRNAKDAIDAYKNITDAINAAEIAAKEAKDAADNALNNVKKQNLTERAKNLKKNGENLLQNANQAEKDLKNAANNLTDLTERMQNADKKKKALQKDLLDAENQLKNIKRDDIGNIIDEAKRKAASANSTATDTMNKLNDIRKEVDKINVSPSDSNLKNVLDGVDQTVKDLLKTIPSLDDKISEVENLTSQFSTSNITENIKKIKELIEQARDAANRIVVPMKFTGDGHVELRPPKNLDDLKAYTDLSLSLQRPLTGGDRGDGRRRRRQTSAKNDMFVLYLGGRDSKNYIGMVLRSNVLYGVYKLNGEELVMKTGFITKSPFEQAMFDSVELHRIYQDAEMVLTKYSAGSSGSQPIKKSEQGQDIKNLLDLTPNDIVFYVGGYPSNFTPPDSLKYPGYHGCIEFSSFNDKVISLYNFKNAEKINPDPPCKRYKSRGDTSYFEGTGYGKMKIDSKLYISMNVYTRSENGLLLYMENEGTYFTLTMEKGIIFLRSNLLEAATDNVKIFPRDNFADVLFYAANNKIIVRANSKQVVSHDLPYDYSKFKECYIGGAPQDLRDRDNITMRPFKGCIKDLKLNRNHKTLDEEMGISNGCPKDSLVTRKAEFNLGSSLSSDLAGFSLAGNVSVSLGFKSTENQGLILQYKKASEGLMNIALQNGYVIVTLSSDMWKSNKQYNDGQWHYVTAKRTAGRAEVIIDDEDIAQPHSGSSSTADTAGSLVLGENEFKGCISNLYTRRPEHMYKAEDFSTFGSSGNVFVDVCTADSPAQQMLDRSPKRDGVMQVINESLSECALPALVQHAYRMGGPVSSLSYNLPLQVLQPRPHFSLDVRTRAPEGLLFFATTRGGRSHLALYISKGRIRLSVGKQKEIFNREKYNDGKWHSIIFSLEKKKFRLVVDGIRAQDGQLTSAELTSMQQFVSPMYLGSLPESLHKELKSKALPKQSVSGCIRNFKMNGAAMSNPTTNHGVGPCFEGQTQRGAYFSGNGAHVIINDSFVVDPSFELLFSIRPRSPTGLLLHVGDFNRSQNGITMSHYLSVYMLSGEVVAQVNNGKGDFMVSVKPKASLCDGTFHKISVIKRKNVIQLHVDTVDNYKIGPPSSTNTLTKDSLYVGGIPEMSMQQMIPVTSSFVGCIQDMRINSEPVSFDRLSGVFGPVNLKECPG